MLTRHHHAVFHRRMPCDASSASNETGTRKSKIFLTIVYLRIGRASLEMEAKDRARSTVSRRLATIAGLYKYAVEEDLLTHSSAAHVRRPRLDCESHAVGLDRNEIGAILVAAGLGTPAEHALISLLALNGLRVSEAADADIEDLSTQRGHRVLAITRKGGKKAIAPLAPRTARAIDLAIGERCDGPVFLTAAGRRLDRHGAGRIVRHVAHSLPRPFVVALTGGGLGSCVTK